MKYTEQKSHCQGLAAQSSQTMQMQGTTYVVVFTIPFLRFEGTSKVVSISNTCSPQQSLTSPAYFDVGVASDTVKGNGRMLVSPLLLLAARKSSSSHITYIVGGLVVGVFGAGVGVP